MDVIASELSVLLLIYCILPFVSFVVLCTVQCTHLINSMLCTKSNAEATGLRKRVNVRHGQINPGGRVCVCVFVLLRYTQTMVSFLPVLALRTDSFLVIVAAILRLMFNSF
jgi:hypothetical protein